MKGTVVITGASTGIGHAAARELIARGYQVFGSVRKQSDGKRVQKELGESFTPLLFDVTDHHALRIQTVDATFYSLTKRGSVVNEESNSHNLH